MNNNYMFINDNNNNMVNNKSDFFGPFEGFIKGNMSRTLYSPYKNYRPAELVPTNEREELLLNLNQVQFAMHEANLFLDNFPDDRFMIEDFNQFKNMYNELLNDYESKYGPININNEYMNVVPWRWLDNPWPWEGSN